jgi:hypothetical protein
MQMKQKPLPDELRPENFAAAAGSSLRQKASPIRLFLSALGGPRQWSGKTMRFTRTLRLMLNRSEVRRRLERLQKLGYMRQIPTPLQMTVGGLDMVRYFISPGAADYYASRGINFTFHQVLRFVDDPVSVVDPVGVLSDKDTIIGHLLQVVHANPIYDLQLLEMFPDGLDALERATAQMIDGTHPRAISIGAIVEDPEYHQRLLAYVQRYRKDPATPELRRRAAHARERKAFVLAEETFGTMPGAMRYMTRLPATWGGAWRHLRTQKDIDPRYCDEAVVENVERIFR